jgi:peptidoglycan hydrolase-like protein with peptidoglycan-binding domain
MRTLRFVASLVVGLALLMAGTVTVSQAAPAAVPTCTGFTTFYGSFAGVPAHTYRPAQNGNTDCVLRPGDQGPGVYVLQDAISKCYTKIVADGLFGRETDAALRYIQRLHGLVTDGVYGPRTRDAMRWPWYRDSDNGFLGCR